MAEELDVPVEAITTVVSGDTDRTPDGGGTFGLLRNNVLNLRKAAAYTREAALELAAAAVRRSALGALGYRRRNFRSRQVRNLRRPRHGQVAPANYPSERTAHRVSTDCR